MRRPRLPLLALLLLSASVPAVPAAPKTPPVEVYRGVTVTAGVREWTTVWSRPTPEGCWNQRMRRTSAGRTFAHASFVADRGAGVERVSQTLDGGRLSESVGAASCEEVPPAIDAAVVMATARRGVFRPIATTRWGGRMVTVATGPAKLFISGWTAFSRPPRVRAEGPAVVLRSPGGPVRVRVPRAIVSDPAGRTIVPPRVITVTRSVIAGPAAARFSFALGRPAR